MPASLSVLIATCNRLPELQRCLLGLATQSLQPDEVLILDNQSTPPLAEHHLATSLGTIPFRILRPDRLMGVSESRNLLMQEASEATLLILDDDAYLSEPDQLAIISEAFMTLPELGILALPIEDFRYRPSRILSPRCSETDLAPNICGAGYFVGGAHAIRKSLIQEIAYNPNLFYAHEELDLSFQCIQKGYKIGLLKTTPVIHEPPEETKGHPNKKKLYFHVRNRFWIVRVYLPLPYRAVHLGVWTVRYAFRAIRFGLVGDFVRGVEDGFSAPIQDNQRLKPEAISYLKEHNGRLWA